MGVIDLWIQIILMINMNTIGSIGIIEEMSLSVSEETSRLLIPIFFCIFDYLIQSLMLYPFASTCIKENVYFVKIAYNLIIQHKHSKLVIFNLLKSFMVSPFECASDLIKFFYVLFVFL